MQYSYGPWGETIAEFIQASVTAESAGFERVWANELHRNPFIPLAPVATATSKIGIGSAIALAFTRSALTTSLAALDLDEISGGRFILGLGTGVARLNQDWHNIDFGKPVQHLRETVQLIRRFVSEVHLGNRIDFDGTFEHIDIRGFQRPFPPVRDSLPIYLAAMGPAMTALSGEIADGWISHELCSPYYIQSTALPRIKEGLERAKRSRKDITVVASACCVIDSNVRDACRAGAPLVAFYASVKTYEPFFALHGFGAEAEAIRDAFRREDFNAMVEACSDEMVQTFMLAGTADDVRRGLERYEDLADEIKISPPTHLVPDEVIRESQRAILSLFD